MAAHSQEMNKPTGKHVSPQTVTMAPQLRCATRSRPGTRSKTATRTCGRWCSCPACSLRTRNHQGSYRWPALTPPAAALRTGGARTIDRVVVLTSADDAHTPGDVDLEAPRSKIDLAMKLMHDHITKSGGAPGSLKYEMITALGPHGNGIALTFASNIIAQIFLDQFKSGGFTVTDLCGNKAAYKTVPGAEFYDPDQREADPPGTMIHMVRNIPDPRAAAPAYAKFIGETYGKVHGEPKVLTGMLGGVASKFADGAIMIKSANEKNVTALAPTPFYYVGTDQFGNLSSEKKQVGLIGSTICKNDECRAIDDAHVPGCNPSKVQARADELRRAAKVKSFQRRLASQPEQTTKIRHVLARKAAAQGDTFCKAFNKAGIPCGSCKNYPCKEWDELVESLLSTSIYKLMPDGLRTTATGRGRRAGKSRGGKKERANEAARAAKTHFDDENTSDSDADL